MPHLVPSPPERVVTVTAPLPLPGGRVHSSFCDDTQLIFLAPQEHPENFTSFMEVGRWPHAYVGTWVTCKAGI
jgi:hypothetical protein